MPINVEGPDGVTVEFPHDTTPEIMRDAMRRKFGFQEPPKRGMLADVASQLTQGFNRGIEATINLLGTVMNLPGQLINAGAGLLGREAPLPDKVFKPIPLATLANSGDEAATTAGRVAGSVGEAVGGTVLPSAAIIREGAKLAPQAIAAGRGILAKAAQAPKATFRNDLISSVGAGRGVGAARENDLGPAGEFAAGLAGGIAAPSTVNAAARLGGGIKEGRRFANRQVQRVTDPTQAAIDDVADTMIEAKTTPEQVRIALVPEPSPNFQARGINEPEIADMISRSYAGETNRAIATRYGVSEGAVGGYLTKYRAGNPLQRNIIDVAKELRGEGGAKPLADQGRTAMAIGGDAESAKRLTDRQYQQPGRVADTIQQTSIKGGSYDDAVTHLDTIGKQ